MATQATVTASQQHAAAAIAKEYVKSSKRWPEDAYHLEFLRAEGNPASPTLIFDAVHKQDLGTESRGPSRSVQLHIDLGSRKVLKELAYQ